MTKIMRAFELAEIHDGQRFKVKRGRVVWEAISCRSAYSCYVSRLVEAKKGGKPAFLGLNFFGRHIDPNTIVEIVV